jgi:3-oxoacyl-[acyl-carrier protein] reductase
MDAGLTDRVVLISGASGGIGIEMVRAFAAEGARVAVHYHRSAAVAQAALADLDQPDRHTLVRGDLTDEQAVAAVWQAVEQQLGPVDIVIANAGVWVPEDVPLHEMSLTQWETTVAVDLTAVFLCMREFFRGIIRHQLKDPAAVLVGSTAAVFGEAGHADYAAAKGGLVHGFMLSLKNEIARLAPRGRVNAVCPGWTITPMTERFMDQPDTVRRALQTMPMRKVGRPEDVVSATLFLSSSRLAGHVTGQAIMTAGGMEGRVLYPPGEIDPSQV